MKSFKEFLLEDRAIGKKMGHDLYVHKNYVHQVAIPKDIHNSALIALHKNYPDFNYTIVKYNKLTNNSSFLNSPDWDTAHEPQIKDSVMITPEGGCKYTKPKKIPQIYHQKWAFVGDDYKGFDVDRSKLRTKQYQKAIVDIADKTGQPTKAISSRIGYKDYWDREIAPHIGE
jgi:hypothetical protein